MNNVDASQTASVVLATTNLGKVLEFSRLLEGINIVAPSDRYEQAEETGASFFENALLKAEHASATEGLISLADDSGLEVAALRGAPGVYSARYAGDGVDASNRAKLLHELAGVSDRRARFRCVLVLYRPVDGAIRRFDGSVEGVITLGERGDGGFGYDSIFVPLDGDGRTFAEMSLAEKSLISHRGEAIAQLRQYLADDEGSGFLRQ